MLPVTLIFGLQLWKTSGDIVQKTKSNSKKQKCKNKNNNNNKKLVAWGCIW